MAVDDFRQFLHKRRNYRVNGVRCNPAEYIDDQVKALGKYIKTIQDWLSNTNITKSDRTKVAEALDYFDGEYAYAGEIYRGTGKLIFDGLPASYTKDKKVATEFATKRAEESGKAFLIDRKAPKNSLDLSKLLREYASCTGESKSYCFEKEVIIFNTNPPRNGVTEFIAEFKSTSGGELW